LNRRELSAAGDNAQKREEIERKYARKQKAVALSQAIINTAVAVTKALPSLVLAALAAASGAVQIDTISAQKFAKGGTVPPGYTNDTYPALLSSGETVTPPIPLRNEDMMPATLETRLEDDAIVIAYNRGTKRRNKYT